MENNNKKEFNNLTGARINDKLTVHNDNACEFEEKCNSKIILTTLSEIGKEISGVFRPIFADYAGCQLFVSNVANVQNAVIIKFVFNVFDQNSYDDKRIYAFKSTNTNMKGTNSITRAICNSINNSNSDVKRTRAGDVKMTQDAKDVFSDYLLYNGNQKVNWNALTAVSDSVNVYQQYTGSQIVLSGMDVMKILPVLYSDTDVAYVINPNYPVVNYKPFNMQQPNAINDADWRVSIQQYDNKSLDVLYKEAFGISDNNTGRGVNVY